MHAPEQEKPGLLLRGLKNRHIQMIALGGAIGTGLFYGSAEAIMLAGPSTTLAYLMGGLVIYLIMRMLGEMAVDEPVSGAFSFFAYKYWGRFAGFVAGWNYWLLYILVSMVELIVIGIYINHWFMIEPWKCALITLIIITTINLFNVRLYGEFEFWLALIKIIAVCGMIVFGIFLILAHSNSEQISIANLWQYGGFFPMGLGGMALALMVVMFSFGGTELIGITAGEAEDPKHTIPKAIHQVMWRILVFYIGAIIIIMILNPWNVVGQNGSPFVQIFDNIGIPAAGHILNFVVLTAAISVYNSGIYSNGRMLYSLAEQGNAPKIFMRVSRQHVPFLAILFSSLCTLTAVVINYLVPDGAFLKVMAVATTAAAITWGMIVLVHLRFRRQKKLRGEAIDFLAPFYPYANYICLAFLAFVIGLMVLSGFTEEGAMTGLMRSFGVMDSESAPLLSVKVPDMSVSALIMPLWILVLFIGYRLKKN